MNKEALKQLGSHLQYDYSKENRDYVYNLIARDRAAYISVLFPLTCILVYLDFGKIDLTEYKPWIYVFNIVVSVGLFLPALFFLYKLMIRDLSEFIIEKLIFMILGQPHRLIYRKGWSVLKIPIEERKRVLNHAQTEFNMSELNYNLDNGSWRKQRTDKNLSDALDALHDQLKQYDKIKESSIAFEFNCIYGFYRNLAGGLFLDTIIAGIITSAYKTEDQHSSSIGTGMINVVDFASHAVYWLLGCAMLVSILAYFARIKQMKRHAHLYLKHHSQAEGQ